VNLNCHNHEEKDGSISRAREVIAESHRICDRSAAICVIAKWHGEEAAELGLVSHQLRLIARFRRHHRGRLSDATPPTLTIHHRRAKQPIP
jgi:hypothetical protein